ncbi:hypothetical protein [Salinimicrobium sp. HB62]|uniref:hypothetical protein n=1 Tax=Salinimicrobium sp. HB62 TaxID=3077781 RepID=UPI002D778A1F|nr:hypothetical protein [Salinimicrobium sp. HB62]
MKSFNSSLLTLFGALLISIQGLNAKTFLNDRLVKVAPNLDRKIEMSLNESITSVNLTAIDYISNPIFGQAPIYFGMDSGQLEGDFFVSIAGKWIIAPEAGALKVGPEPGSDIWWKVTEETLFERICYFDDVYEFGEDGSFKNILGPETYLSVFQGVSELQCGEPVFPHDGSIPASYEYDAVDGTITLNGKGAFLGLPKVVNGSELEDPASVPESITYDISLSEDGNRMVLMIESTPGTFWTFTLIKDAVFVPDNNFERALIDLGRDSDGTLNHRIKRSQVVGVTELHISDPINNPALPTVNEKISNLTGIEAFTSLSVLDCRKNQIQKLKLFNNTQLTELHGTGNQLTELDISNNPLLSVLFIQGNQIQELDLVNNSDLTVLECGSNQLVELDVSQNLSLRVLGFGLNNISEIDVSNNLALEVFWCNGNPISVLNLDNNPNLEVYGLSNTPLEYVTLRNGNNLNVTYFEAYNTPKLNCIRSDAEISDQMNLPYKTFSEDCSTSIAGKWIIAPEAGALKVGSTPGSDDWWYLEKDEGEILRRACYMDDLYVFSEDGTFSNVQGDETILEPFQGVETHVCGEPVPPHDGSIPASYEYDPINGTITLNGKGSFLGISSAVNAGILPNVPVPESITYNVSFSENGNVMNVSLNWGDGFWTYKLLKDVVFIPDNNFEQALIDLGIDSDGIVNHRILRRDAEAVSSLDVSNADSNAHLPNVGSKIQDLTGIEAFINLTYLTCHSNELTELDVSANTSLRNLHCPINRIETLILPATETLTWLTFSQNNLAEIDLSGTPNLTNLTGSWNQLTSIDLTPHVKLTRLNLSGNKLTSIDLTSNIHMDVLQLGVNDLSSIDLKENTKVTWLNLGQNPLTKVDVSKLTSLENLQTQFTQIEVLDLSNNPIISLSTGYNSNIKHLDMRNGNNSLVTYFNVTNAPNLTCINADPVVSQAMLNSGKNFSEDCGDFVKIPDTNFEQALIDLGIDSDGVVNTSVLREDVKNITSLNLNFPELPNGNTNSFADARLTIAEKITNLTGIEAFGNLTNLQVGFGLLTDIDLSKNTQLEELFLNDNQLNSVDISMLPNLKRFGVMRNNMTSGIDVSGNPLLEELFVHSTGISSIDLSANANLWKLFIAENELTSLDLSANTALKWVSAQHNQLSELDITLLSVIDRVDAQFNPNMTLLTGANGNPTLTSLNLSGTGLSNFNGATYPNLEWLLLNDNSLSNFNGNNNLNLQHLFLNNNIITKLGLTGNAQLTELQVMNNGMEELDLRNGNNVALEKLKATGNLLTCISVDDPTDTSLPYETWEVDLGVIFSLNCKQAPEVILIPDPNFEQALIDLGIDTNGENGALTGNILLSEAEEVNSLNVSGKSITNATGIEGFVNLESLDFSHNLLNEIDLAENTDLIALNLSENLLAALVISNPKLLVELNAANNMLNQLDLVDLTNLEALDLSGNQFTSLDLSDLYKLRSVNVSENVLTSLDLRNGNNSAITFMDATNNPFLNCIGVDDESTTIEDWSIDLTARYTNSGDCEAPIVNTKDVTVYLDRYGLASISPSDIDDGSSDNMTQQKDLIFNLDISDFDCGNLGENTVELSVEDESGNIGSANATVTLKDEIAPSASSLRSFTLDLAGAASVNLNPADINDGSSDNCSVLQYSVDQSTFSFPGEYEVIFTVTDGSENHSSSVTTVQVIDSASNPTSLKFKGNLVVTVYPNPFSNYMRLSFSKPVYLSNVRVEVFQGAKSFPGVDFFPLGNELVSNNIGTILTSIGQYILSVSIDGQTETAFIIRN